MVALVYAAAMASSQVPLQRLARQQVFLNQRLIQTLQEGLGAIRDVLLNGYQGFYETQYRMADKCPPAASYS